MSLNKKLKNWTIGLLAASALGSSALVMPSFAEKAQPPLVGALQPGAPVSFADLIEKVSPAVVSINVITRQQNPGLGGTTPEQVPEELREWFERNFPGITPSPNPDQPPREGRSLGSGFLISAEGYLVTNHHVVDNASEITVSFDDGKEFPARIIGSDQRTDLAVLKIDGQRNLPFVRFAKDVKIRVGDWVVAVGNPFGLGGTATAGIVSATGRQVGGSAYDSLQMDAAINRGNSGGPTFDLYGNVVGVNSQILSPTGGNIGIGFAIPARVAAKITDELIEKGSITRGWLGVQVQRVTADIADSEGMDEPKGAIVADVVADSPAAKAGFEDGDIILQLDGVILEDHRDLTRRVGELFVGHKAKFAILRDGRNKNLIVKIGKRDDDAPVPETPEPEAVDAPDEFGLVLGDLDEEDRERLGIEDERGVLIEKVVAASSAARKGFRPGDAIVSANNMDMKSPDDFTKAVSAVRKDGKKAIKVLVRSRGGQIFAALRLDEPS